MLRAVREAHVSGSQRSSRIDGDFDIFSIVSYLAAYLVESVACQIVRLGSTMT